MGFLEDIKRIKFYFANPTGVKGFSTNDYTDAEKTKLANISESGGSDKCVATATLAADGDTTIAGGAFTPPITSEPIYITVFLAGVKQNVGSVSYALNGSVYDITIGTTEVLTNAKINVLI